jgi:hypothetical protein
MAVGMMGRYNTDRFLVKTTSRHRGSLPKLWMGADIHRGHKYIQRYSVELITYWNSEDKYKEQVI